MSNRSHSSRKRLPAFGLALLAAVAMATVGAGSASALSISPAPSSFTLHGSGFYWAVPGSATRKCESTEGSGKVLTGDTGEIRLYLRGCTGWLAGSKCTTTGQSTGTIITAALKYKLVYQDAAQTKFGMLLIPPDATYLSSGNPTPGTGTFAEFSCSGSGSFKWTGSVIGQITSPGLNVPSYTATLAFPTSQAIEGAKFGPFYGLSESRNGGSAQAVAIEATHTLTFEKQATFLP